MAGVAARTITGSRGKAFGLMLASLALTAGGVASLRAPGHADWRSWLGIALFGPGALVFAWLLVRPQELRLDAQGFTIAGGLVRAPRSIRWADVDGFFVYRLPRGGRLVGFNYAGERPASVLRSVTRRLGADGAITRGFPGSPEALAADLNAYRARALAARAVPPPASKFGRRA